MKKLFAALLAISVTTALTGCNKPENEQLIDKISEDTSVSSAEANETENASETETTAETVSDTEKTAAVTDADFSLLDEASLYGDWYEVNVTDWENRYSFGKDGSIEATQIFDKEYVYTHEKGTYTVSNGLVSAEYEANGKTYKTYYVGVMYGDMLIIQPVYDEELINNGYKPYDGSMTLAEYLAGLGKWDSDLPAVMTHSQEPPSDEIYDFAAQLREDVKAWWDVYNP